MTPFWRRIGWLVMALLFASGCASPSRANAPSAGEDSTAVQKVILAQPAGEEELKLKPVDPMTQRGGLVIIDAERIRVLDRLGSGANFEPVGFSSDGRHTYVMTEKTVKVLDLETRRFLSERDGVELLIIKQRRESSTEGPRFPLTRARESGEDFRIDSAQ
ncbi:hypothetical protein CLV97_11162 [Planifilum fimeticola]|uniref:Uncharacterized protein n=1 Tax=Planifilum fimeticola TaxID=201975 RepID=A0A2T0LEX5_9BACL|nr:hypothetical protein [Planifilum fimeticola]PRX40720.1 hypothetical protein CLV97_11162 [Planifilum fimeticola]